MYTKSRRLLSTLLTLALVLCLFAALPLTASATVRTANNATELKTALDTAASGDTIKLIATINYTEGINVNGKSITLDLNGHSLNVSVTSGSALRVSNGGMFLLQDPTNGGFNLSGSGSSVAVYLEGNSSKVEVINVVYNGDGPYGGVFAERGEATVYGNVETTTTNTEGGYGVWGRAAGTVIMKGNINVTGSAAAGAIASEGSKVTVDGTITVSNIPRYVSYGTGTSIAKETGVPSTTKPGYLEYSNGTNFIWVKIPAPVFTTQPSNQTVVLGEIATFNVVATGADPLSCEPTTPKRFAL